MLIKAFTTIIVVVSFVIGSNCSNNDVSVKSYSQTVSREKILQETNVINDNNSSLELVVKTYCEYAKDGKFDELKKLITAKSIDKTNKNNKKSEQSNEEVVEDNQLQTEMSNLLLKKLIPDSIYSGKMFIEQIKTISSENHIGKVYVILNSPIDKSLRTAKIFYLFQDKKEQWKIYKAEYTTIEITETNKEKIDI